MSDYKYRCLDCGRKFNDNDFKREPDFELGRYIPVIECPYCGGDFEEIEDEGSEDEE